MDDKLKKQLIKNYHSTIIPLCRLLKPHATNALLLPDGVIVLYPTMSGIRNYMILNTEYLEDYSKFIYTFFTIPEISKINTKFKKTKSDIDWRTENGQTFLVVRNNEEDFCESPLIINDELIKRTINDTYKSISDNPIEEISNDPLDTFEVILNCEDFINKMLDKKLCQLIINGNPILLARPFLGDLKKTKEVRYKIIDETEDTITIKFVQVEEFGKIYTYSKFIKMQ